MSNEFDFSNLFADLDTTKEELAAMPTKKGASKIDFDCIECGGSGLWDGGRQNRHGNHKCWTCGGRGKVATDPRKLRENRAKRAQKKADDFQAFHDANADVIRIIGQAADWSDFARSLIEQLHGRKPWSDKQLASARSMAAKLAARAEERAKADNAAKQENRAEVNLDRIREMFDRAVANGYKKPKYRAEGLELSLAPAAGRNPGALYVIDIEADYQGKILGTSFEPTRKTLADVKDRLQAIAADPLGAAIRYGQRTGTCSCCGRKLTNHTSIDAGIGPICAEKWGF